MQHKGSWTVVLYDAAPPNPYKSSSKPDTVQHHRAAKIKNKGNTVTSPHLVILQNDGITIQ